MQIFFCETCGRRVSDVELARGECRQVGDQVWCKKCLPNAPAPPPRVRPPTPLRAAPQARGRARASETPPGPKASSPLPLFAGAFGIGLGVAIGILVLAGGKRPAPRPAPALEMPAPAVLQQPVPPGAGSFPAADPARAGPVAGPVATKAAGGSDDLEEYRRHLKRLAEPGAARETGGEFFAKVALDEALRYAVANPEDAAGQLERFGRVERNYPGTPMAVRASEEAKKLREKHPHLAAASASEPAFPTVRALDCPRRDGPVVVDGRLDEWKALPHECLAPAQIQFSPASWRGPEDSSFRFAVAHDAEGLYVAVDVTDDRLVIVPNEPPWVHDGIEIRIDARADPPRSFGRGEGEFDQILLVAMYPGDTAEASFIWNREKLPSGLKAACVKSTKGYVAELALPGSYLNGKQGREWDSFRLNICVDDMDGAPGDRNETAQIWWQPDWRQSRNVIGSGTFARR